MLSTPTPENIVLGTVPYLNVQPMIWAINTGIVGKNVSIIPQVPRQLAAELYLGHYDTAIVPVFEYFRRPDHYSYINGPVIATRDAVLSVMLYSSEPLPKLHTVYLDASSLTSVHLFQVLAAEGGYNLEFIDTSTKPVPRPLPPGTGWVVIGDPAIAELSQHPCQVDLGSEWKKLTGLPFVFAAWLVPKQVKDKPLTRLLNDALLAGLTNLDQVANETAGQFNVSPDFALRYFSENIQYHLGDEELAGWKEFARLCYKHRLIEKVPDFREYR